MTPPWFFCCVWGLFAYFRTHSTCSTWPLPPAGFLPWAGTSRLRLLSWRVQGRAAASQPFFFFCFEVVRGDRGWRGHSKGPGPGMRLIYELINRSSVWASKTTEVCELFHVTVCACWLSPSGKHSEPSLPVLFGSLTCFQKQLGR